MSVTLLPDIERILSTYLRSRSEVTALVSTRVYTEIPKDPTFPLVRLTRVGGSPVTSTPLWVDEPLVQFDVWGGPKVLAREIAETIRSVLAEARLTAHADASIDDVTFGAFQWLPDDTYEPAKPRYSFDALITVHPT